MNMKMRQMIWLLAVLLLSTFAGAPANAYERTIKAEWDKYTPPVGLTTTGFKLYKEGVVACSFTGQAIVSGECTVDLVKASTPFTLTALFSDGNESPHSAPFTLIDYGPGPGGLKLTVLTIKTISRLTKSGNVIASTKMTKKDVDAGTPIKEGTTGYRNAKGEWISTTIVAYN